MPLKTNNVEVASIRRTQILEDIASSNTNLQQTLSTTTESTVIEVPLVRVITTTNITLNDEQTYDGIALVEGDYVLVNGQTDEADNGRYIVIDNANWERVNTNLPYSGQPVIVKEGTINANTFWIQARECDPYNEGTSDIKWVKIGDVPAYITAIADTNTVNLTVTGTTLSADVRYQDSLSVDFSDDAGGLRADVRLATPQVGGAITEQSGGLRWDNNLVKGLGIQFENNVPTTGDMTIKHNFSPGLGIFFTDDTPSTGQVEIGNNINPGTGIVIQANTPSAGQLRIGHNLSEGEGILLTANVPSTGNLNVKVDPNYVTNTYGNRSMVALAFVTTHTFRVPSNPLEFLPKGLYQVNAYGTISTFFNFTPVRHEISPALTIKNISNSTNYTVDRGATHADPATGVHDFRNNLLNGSILLDITSSTQADRYFEVEFNLAVSDSTNVANRTGVVGYVDFVNLKPFAAIVYET